ncbi:hypothetical protein BS78_07G012400 [Paspalum vaginatum]|nr:hypothetical protein BS78_07G012400 [Paspalum vaginatum]
MESSTGDGDVRIVSRRLVRPEPASSPGMVPSSEPPEVIHLTPWDLQLLTVDHTQHGILLPMPRTGGGGAQVVVDDLASSLSLALGRFYPLAGRLTTSEVTVTDGESSTSPSLVISLCCNSEGAEFVHAVAPGVTVSDIATPLYRPPVVSSLFPLNGLLNVDAVVSSLPVLAAQVTELADGVFVAMSLNHGVADGTTFWHLFSTWSEINRRRTSGGGEDISELSTPPPALARWFLDTCPVPIPLPFSKPEDLFRRPQHTPMQECFLHFSAESVKKLKAKAKAEMAAAMTEPPPAAVATISSLQSLLAHLWRAVCGARGLAPHVATTYKLPVGLRGRVQGIPQEYVGNALTFAVARSTVGELLDNRGLGRAAWLLNRAVAAAFDEVRAMEELASWAQKPRLRHVVPRRNPARVVTGGSPRSDVYGNDFGWGPPVAVRSGDGDKVDGKVTLYEGRGGGGALGLEVCLSPEALARLVADEEFMEAVG